MFPIEDFFCGQLEFLKVKVNVKDVLFFNEAIMDEDMPDEFTLEVDECIIKVNRIKKEFRILKRFKNYNPCNSDLQIMIVLKIAKLAGFKIYAEPKYMN